MDGQLVGDDTGPYRCNRPDPILVNTLFNIVPMETVIAKYSNETIFLLLGAELLIISWSVTGLDKRIALKSLCWIGPSLTQQVVVWFVVPALLSNVLPNMVVCAMVIPIALSMLRYIGEGDLKKGPGRPDHPGQHHVGCGNRRHGHTDRWRHEPRGD